MRHSRPSASSKRVFTIGALVLVVMFKFQNCAPPSGLQNQAGEDGLPDGEVRIVDRWAPQKIEFMSPSQLIESEERSVQVHGLCVGSDKGEQIAYQVIEISNDPRIVYQGVVNCVMGGFELTLQSLTFTSCSSRYQVRATRLGDEQNYAETVLQPNCSS